MKYGFTLPGRGPFATPDALATITRRGEELGYDHVMFGDHIVVPRQIASPYPDTEHGEFPGSASGEAMEQLTVLAFLAGQTRTIRLVTRCPFRKSCTSHKHCQYVCYANEAPAKLAG